MPLKSWCRSLHLHMYICSKGTTSLQSWLQDLAPFPRRMRTSGFTCSVEPKLLLYLKTRMHGPACSLNSCSNWILFWSSWTLLRFYQCHGFLWDFSSLFPPPFHSCLFFLLLCSTKCQEENTVRSWNLNISVTVAWSSIKPVLLIQLRSIDLEHLFIYLFFTM